MKQIRHKLVDAMPHEIYSFQRAIRVRKIIISRKIAFTHIPKNGGTSVSHLLYDFNIGHIRGLDLCRTIPREIPKFAILRDPMERFLSAYRHMQSGRNEGAFGVEFRHTKFSRRLAAATSIDNILETLQNDASTRSWPLIFKPQSYFITDKSGKHLRDLRILAMEDVPKYLRTIDTTIRERMPHHNASQKLTYEISPEVRQAVEELYSSDYKAWEKLRNRVH